MNSTDHPTLVVVRGLPGSGKSYLVERLLGMMEPGSFVSLDPDVVDQSSPEYLAHSDALAAEGVEPRVHLFRFSRAKALRAIEERKLVIWNQPFSNLPMFDRMTAFLHEYAAAHGTRLSILLVEVRTDPALAYQRVVARKQAGGHGPSSGKFQSYVTDYVSYARHGYDVLTVDGADDVDQIAATVLDRIKKIAA